MSAIHKPDPRLGHVAWGVYERDRRLPEENRGKWQIILSHHNDLWWVRVIVIYENELGYPPQKTFVAPGSGRVDETTMRIRLAWWKKHIKTIEVVISDNAKGAKV